MLKINYSESSNFCLTKVHIIYDVNTNELQFDYTFNNEHLENYEYDYQRIRTIIAKENIEQFFKVRTYKVPKGMIGIDVEGFTYVEVEYNNKKRTLDFQHRGEERVYVKAPIVLIEKIDDYLYDLGESMRKQLAQKEEKLRRKNELEEMGIVLPENPTEEMIIEYQTGLMWESLSYGETIPTEQERKNAAEKFNVSLEDCEKMKYKWWKRLRQHHKIKWL